MNATATLAVMASINNFVKGAMVKKLVLLIKKNSLRCVIKRASGEKQNWQHVSKRHRHVDRVRMKEPRQATAPPPAKACEPTRNYFALTCVYDDV